MSNEHADRCLGCLLGTACGDVLGVPVEGWDAESIRARFGELRDFAPVGSAIGRYSDDTQMTLALAASLVDRGRVDAAHVSAEYARYHQSWRGYSGTTSRLLQALESGADYRETGRMFYPDGSLGNGGAMRIAPVGLAYRHAPADVLHEAVEAALLPTHVHPQAIDGAFIQAKAVAMVATTDGPDEVDNQALLDHLRTASRHPLMREKLTLLSRGLDEGSRDDDVIPQLVPGHRAPDTVAAALWAFLRYGDSPETCIIRAVGFGGDTDTVGAMAGALAGALSGAAWIPKRWFDQLENGPNGRDEIVRMARRLAALDVSA